MTSSSLVQIELDEEKNFEILLAEAEAKRSAVAEAVAAARAPHVVVPALKDGKTHHLFVSHADADSKWAEALINILEEERGLKCLWYKRDFKAGRTTVACIHDGIACCMKSLFILTPSFLESDWCMQEIDWAVGFSVAERGCLTIPLLLEQCEMPSVFKTFHYIDVPRGDDYVDRIVRSFDPEDDLQTMVAAKVEFISQKGCGMTQVIWARKDVKSRCRGTSWSFRELQPLQRTRINSLGSKFAEDMVNRTMEIVNGSDHLRYYSLGQCSCQCFLFLFCIIAVVILLVMLCGIFVLYSTKEFAKTNYLHIPLWPIIVMVPVLIAISRKRSYKKVCKDVLNLSVDHVKETNVLVYYWNDSDTPYIQIMYTDIHPCLDYMTNRILRGRTQMHADVELAKAKARLTADTLVISYLKSNMEHFLLWTIAPDSVAKRHPTYLNKMCLCERIERAWDY